MKLSQQVITLEKAKRLKELGVAQDSLFSWFGDEIPRLLDNCADGIEYGPWLFLSTTIPANNQELDWREDVKQTKPIAAAFTVAELGIMLPEYIGEWFLEMYKDASNGMGEEWFLVRYYERDAYETGDKIRAGFNQQTEAEARGAMLEYLLVNNLITAEEVNTRLQD